MMIKLRLSIGVFMGLIMLESVSTVDYINKGDTCSVLQALEDKSAEVQFLKRQIQALQDQLRRRKDVLGRIRGLELKTNRVDAMLKSVQAQLGAFTGGAGPKGSGAVYVRWGRTVCPGDSILIYEGFAGGSFVTYGGGGSNYVCLPRDPEWGKTVEGRQDCISLMFGAEYQSCAGNDHLFSKENADSGALYDEDVPCAVCQASGRQSHVMIPAKINCPDGWLREYFGYLMSSHYEHKRTEWVCVDPAPEVILKGSENTNGALFYFTEAACGSLPCPPYRDGEELTCVVCTK